MKKYLMKIEDSREGNVKSEVRLLENITVVKSCVDAREKEGKVPAPFTSLMLRFVNFLHSITPNLERCLGLRTCL